MLLGWNSRSVCSSLPSSTPILGVYPLSGRPDLAKTPIIPGLWLGSVPFSYIANGQFPSPYPLKHSFSLPLYSTLKKPKSVRPIFTFCPSYLSFHKSFLSPKRPKSRHLHPPPSNAIPPSFKRRTHKAHISHHNALNPNKQRELPPWYKKGRRRKPTALRRKPHANPCARLYPQK